jgi:hypothetical protein
VPEKVTVEPVLSLVRSSVVFAGTVMPLMVILVHDATARKQGSVKWSKESVEMRTVRYLRIARDSTCILSDNTLSEGSQEHQSSEWSEHGR